MASPPTCPNGVYSLQQETTHRGFWDCVVPAEHTLQDVLSPAYFGKVCSDKRTRGRLCVGDFIDIESEDCSWFVRVRVMSFSPALQRAVTYPVHGPIDFAVKVSEGYDIKWHGKEKKWCIERGDDRIAGGFASKIEAQVKLDEMLAEGRRAA